MLAKPQNRGDGKQERTILLVNNTESPYKWSELLERTTSGLKLKYCQTTPDFTSTHEFSRTTVGD